MCVCARVFGSFNSIYFPINVNYVIFSRTPNALKRTNKKRKTDFVGGKWRGKIGEMNAFAFDTHTHTVKLFRIRCYWNGDSHFLPLQVTSLFLFLAIHCTSFVHRRCYRRRRHRQSFRSLTLHIKSSQVKSQFIMLYKFNIILQHIYTHIEAFKHRLTWNKSPHSLCLEHNTTNRHKAITILIIMIMIMKIIQFKVI